MKGQTTSKPLDAARRLGYFGVCIITFAAIAGSGQSTGANATDAAKPAIAADNAPAGFHLSSFRHSRPEFRHSRESGNLLLVMMPLVRHDGGALRAQGDSRFRGNDGIGGIGGIDGIDGIIDINGISTNNFADFRKQAQMRLLSSLDAALSQKAQDTVLQLPAVQKAEVQLQTELGGRKANLGVNFIGAFAKHNDRAIGWQVRAYAGEDEAIGANAGIFHRSIIENQMLGINAFADYESGDYGTFVRYSIGGEWQNSIFNLAANYYAPATGEKKTDSGNTVAFSRRGYDAKLRINIPNEHIRAVAEYYYFDGKHSATADEGIRYGMEAQLLPNLRFAFLYDDNGDKFGGEMAYVHTIGEAPTSYGGGEIFEPDLFAPVSRENAQRIAVAERAPEVSVSVRLTPLMTVTNSFTIAAVTTATTMTAAPITTIMTMTAASITTSITTNMTMDVNVQTRRASVQFWTHYSPAIAVIEVSTRYKVLMTMPAPSTSRPWIINTRRNFMAEFDGIVTAASVTSDDANSAIRSPADYHFQTATDQNWLWRITIVPGSEDYVSTLSMQITENRSTMTMAGMTTTTTMTAAGPTTAMTTTMTAMTTHTTMTTFLTTSITLTLTANAAAEMPHLPPPSKLPLPFMPQMAMADTPMMPHHPRRHKASRIDPPPNPAVRQNALITNNPARLRSS